MMKKPPVKSYCTNNWISVDVQIKNLTGYATTSSNRVYLQLYYIFRNIRGFQWQEFVMGASLLLLLFALQFLSNRYPRCSLESHLTGSPSQSALTTMNRSQNFWYWKVLSGRSLCDGCTFVWQEVIGPGTLLTSFVKPKVCM